MGTARIEILRLVLEATIKGACRPPRQSDLRAHDTTELYDVSRRHPKVSSPTGDPARGHERLTSHFVAPAAGFEPATHGLGNVAAASFASRSVRRCWSGPVRGPIGPACSCPSQRIDGQADGQLGGAHRTRRHGRVSDVDAIFRGGRRRRHRANRRMNKSGARSRQSGLHLARCCGGRLRRYQFGWFLRARSASSLACSSR